MRGDDAVIATDLVPTISVVVPTFGRPDALRRCLRALARQEYPHDRYDVVVVDDGSPVPPREVVGSVESPLRTRLVCQPHRGPAAARNKGAAQARGEFLAFTDDDCMPSEQWLPSLASALGQYPGAAVAGSTINALPDNAFASGAQSLIDYLYGYYNASPADGRFLTANNVALPAAAFREIGGFDATFASAGGEDRDFCDRWLASGRRLIHEASARVSHAHHMTLSGFVRQQFEYGRGACRYHRLRTRRGGGRVAIEPPAFYAKMFTHPFTAQPWPRAVVTSLLFAASQAANTAGFIAERLSGPSR